MSPLLFRSGASSRLKRFLPRCVFYLLPAALLCLAPARIPAAENNMENILSTASPVNGWVSMPPSVRATYIGIHGGTVPVSLLASKDCTHMVALVGRTGNDFLQILRSDASETVNSPVETVRDPQAVDADHSEAEPRAADAGGQSPARSPSPFFAGNATVLKAETALGNMPVIYATGYSFAGMAELYADLMPFGLFEHSPLLEGAVKGPLRAVKKAGNAKRRPMLRRNAASIE